MGGIYLSDDVFTNTALEAARRNNEMLIGLSDVFLKHQENMKSLIDSQLFDTISQMKKNTLSLYAHSIPIHDIILPSLTTSMDIHKISENFLTQTNYISDLASSISSIQTNLASIYQNVNLQSIDALQNITNNIYPSIQLEINGFSSRVSQMLRDFHYTDAANYIPEVEKDLQNLYDLIDYEVDNDHQEQTARYKTVLKGLISDTKKLKSVVNSISSDAIWGLLGRVATVIAIYNQFIGGNDNPSVPPVEKAPVQIEAPIKNEIETDKSDIFIDGDRI